MPTAAACDDHASTRRTELDESLADLAAQSATASGRQRSQLMEDVRKRADPVVLDQLGQEAIPLDWLIALWNGRLRRSLEQDVPRERILCGFNAFVDVGYQVDSTPEELQVFQQWVGVPADRGTEGTIGTPGQILGTLLEAFQAPHKEWKKPLDEKLWDRLQEYLEGRRAEGAKVSWRMGGASGNMAHVLRRLGISTTGYWPYHSSEMAKDAPPCLKRLRLEGGQKREEPAADPQPDPVRRSFVFDFLAGAQKDGVTAKGTGRLILLAPKYVSQRHPPWKRVVLRSTTPAGDNLDAEIANSKRELGKRGWPFFPVFASRHTESDALVVEFASDELIKRIAEQFDYLLLGGIQSIDDPLHSLETLVAGKPAEPTVRTIIKHTLARQLRTLAAAGVVIHWEIGGVRSPRLLDDLREICCGSVRSAALNHDELAGITQGPALRHTRFHLPMPATRRQDMLWRYDLAVHLARQLDLDQLYVHGNDADLIVRRRTTRGALRQEIAVTLFAKGVVLLSLLQRSVENWQDYVGREELPVLLTVDGFLRLLELAKGLAMRHFPDDAALERRTFTDIAQSGYYYERNLEDYSVMVVPVMWPELPIPFSTAGAGDVTSSVVAIYAGK